MPSILHPVIMYTGGVRAGNDHFEFVDGRCDVPNKLKKDIRKSLERQGFTFSDSQPEDDDYQDPDETPDPELNRPDSIPATLSKGEVKGDGEHVIRAPAKP